MNGILAKAIEALTRLDAPALEELERRAANLQALLRHGTERVALPETAARFRVFAGVLKATGDTMRVLERVEAGGVPWER